MKKAIVLGILFLLSMSFVVATDNHPWLAPAFDLQSSISPTGECRVSVNAFSTRTVRGAWGKLHDGTYICFSPR